MEVLFETLHKEGHALFQGCPIEIFAQKVIENVVEKSRVIVVGRSRIFAFRNQIFVRLFALRSFKRVPDLGPNDFGFLLR